MTGKSTIGEVCKARLVEGPDGVVVASPAAPYVERMENETREEDRIILASCALRQDPTCIEVRIPMHPAHPYRFEAAHRSEVMAPTIPISSRPPF